MRQFVIISLLCVFCLSGIAQTQSETQQIARFKNNYLKKAKLNQPDTLKLYNFMLIREKYPEFRTVKTFGKDKEFILEESYYNKTTQLKSIHSCDSIGKPVGVAWHFTRKGEPEYIQDYDKGEWTVFDRENHPYYDVQRAVKLKADSLISKMYGHTFLLNHTTWSVGGSYISNEKEKERWTSNLKSAPTKFEFCYKVSLDSQKMYESYNLF